MLADASTSIFCFLYIGTTLITLPSLREEANGPSLSLAVKFVTCFTGKEIVPIKALGLALCV